MNYNIKKLYLIIKKKNNHYIIEILSIIIKKISMIILKNYI